MGRVQRDKGNREERSLVSLFREAGFEAVRVPLSGAAEGHPGDLKVEGLTLESKVRFDGFRQLYQWIEKADVLIVRANYKPPLVVMPMDGFVRLLQGVAWALAMAGIKRSAIGALFRGEDFRNDRKLIIEPGEGDAGAGTGGVAERAGALLR